MHPKSMTIDSRLEREMGRRGDEDGADPKWSDRGPPGGKGALGRANAVDLIQPTV